jgi:type III secretion system FlhB-like substrate exporter
MKLPRGKTRDVAIGLHFDPLAPTAPTIAGVGLEQQARTLVRLARRYGIPLTEDESLVSRLYSLPEDSEVPAELYAEIATLFAALETEEG